MRPGVPPIRAALQGAAFLFALLAGCAGHDSFHHSQRILADAAERGFVATDMRVAGFRLAALLRAAPSGGDRLTVYIEGDGAPWSTPWHPPQDPTPLHPLALALATADPASRVAYLGRPCQYLPSAELQACDSAYWTERRFAQEVVAAFDAALNRLRELTGARRLTLVGHSGGGVLATLLAARRDDVELLVTVAAPLALAEWTAWHDASPLAGSLDPAKLGDNVRLPRSVHFVGGDDRNVPPAIVEHFIRRQGGRIAVIDGFDHECCWVRDWKSLLGQSTMEIAK